MEQEILIYTHQITNRLNYIFQLMFADMLNVQIRITDSEEDFSAFEGVKFSYSKKKINDELYFQSSSLLFETGIKEQQIHTFNYNDDCCFFDVGGGSALPFDPFAASFYLVSRYEEYLPHIRDEHDRFLAKESLAYQKEFLNRPLVNVWAKEIKRIIQDHYPDFTFPEQKFSYVSTIDVDNAYAYKNKGIVRVLGGLAKSVLQGDFQELRKRISVLSGKTQDPYDTFDYQLTIHQQFNITPIYFILLADYGVNDKNIPVRNREFKSLIKSLADYYPLGIHPSYASNADADILKKEIGRLKEITVRNVTKSRQHFLKLSLPDTYRNLVDNDILEEYSMGYADQSGFRASICTPFKFYDLDTEAATNLTIYPFTVMEATYQYYKQLQPEEALKEIMELMKTVKEVQGNFISVWHNESLSDEGIWKGWKMVYEKMIQASEEGL